MSNLTPNLQENENNYPEIYTETNNVDYTKLLTTPFKNNYPLWDDFMIGMGNLLNSNIQSAVDELANIRDPYVAPQFAALNTRMLGFNVPNGSFTPEEYTLLMVYLGDFWQTRGASTQFLNFLCFIKNIFVTYTPLWANIEGYSITTINQIPVGSLSGSPGTPIWQGGTWFPTTYYDATYDTSQVPFNSTEDFVQFLYQIQPAHLVLRNLGGVVAVQANGFMSLVALPNSYAPAVIAQA